MNKKSFPALKAPPLCNCNWSWKHRKSSLFLEQIDLLHTPPLIKFYISSVNVWDGLRECPRSLQSRLTPSVHYFQNKFSEVVNGFQKSQWRNSGRTLEMRTGFPFWTLLIRFQTKLGSRCSFVNKFDSVSVLSDLNKKNWYQLHVGKA